MEVGNLRQGTWGETRLVAEPPFMESWAKVHCPECGAKNWLYYGHSQRAHANEPDACECHKCKHVFKLFDDDAYLEPDDPEDWNTEVGRPEP